MFRLYLCASSGLYILTLASFLKAFLCLYKDVDSSFSFRLFFSLRLSFSPDDDDDDDDNDDDGGNSDSLLFDNISLVIGSFLAFPSCFTSRNAGAIKWLPLKLFMVSSSSSRE